MIAKADAVVYISFAVEDRSYTGPHLPFTPIRYDFLYNQR